MPFALDPWRVIEDGVDAVRDLASLAVSESVFTVANGYLGLRGVLDEGRPSAERGTFLAGVYEAHPLSYPEGGFGHPEVGEALVGVAEGQTVRLTVDGHPFDVRQHDVTRHVRTLDMRAGTLAREVEWRTPAGNRMRLRSIRLVSLVDRSVCAVEYELEALDEPAVVAVRSELVVNDTPSRISNGDPRVDEALRRPFSSLMHRPTELGGILVHRTRRSELDIAAGVEHDVEGLHDARLTTEVEDDSVVLTAVGQLRPGTPLRLRKFMAYIWADGDGARLLAEDVRAALAQVRHRGWDGLLRAQREELDGFWAAADVEVDGAEDLQQALRFSLFQVLQATACTTGTSVGAKALSGSGYSGHTFWDVEGFVVPVLNFVRPRSAAALLRWRASTLDLARERAQELGLAGVSFPWRTVSGPEVSAYWPASTAAMHVNASIARGFSLHAHVTGSPLGPAGLQVLVETARLWISMGHHDADGGWHLFGMTGPDEYTGVVDDNVFTNLMAARNLAVAARECRAHADHAAALGVDADEVAMWQQTADAAVVLYDERLGVHPASDNFTSYREWDFEGRQDWYPVQEHAHYGKIYRRQIVKQADLVLALWWCGDRFTDEQVARDLEYYEARTVRDSSLSASVQAVVCAQAGHLDLAYAYLREAALIDLRDVNSDTYQGLHLAAMAGSWLALVAGLGGMREDGELLRLAPRLPSALRRHAYRLRWRGSLLRVETTSAGTRLTLADGGSPVELLVDGERVTVGPGEGVTVPLVHPTPLLPPPSQPANREPRV